MVSEIVVDGRRLIQYGVEMWSDTGLPNAHIVGRHGALYQADVGHGTAAWHDTPQEAVDHARRADLNRLNRQTGIKYIVPDGGFL
jgi:hypothetical protein